MALRSSNRVSIAFSMSSMTDIVFLLLIFFMITSTLIHPNAIKLLLPQSNNQTSAKPVITVSITKNMEYYIESSRVDYSKLESVLQYRLKDVEDPTISLHVDKSIPVDEVVKVMNIARKNNFKLILATKAEG